MTQNITTFVGLVHVNRTRFADGVRAGVDAPWFVGTVACEVQFAEGVAETRSAR